MMLYGRFVTIFTRFEDEDEDGDDGDGEVDEEEEEEEDDDDEEEGPSSTRAPFLFSSPVQRTPRVISLAMASISSCKTSSRSTTSSGVSGVAISSWANRMSFSTATTRAPAARSSLVRLPLPGPTSRIRSPGEA